MFSKKYMPNRDKTGPQGKGPRTGRGMGDCGSNKGSQPTGRTGIRQGLGGRPNRRGDGRGLGKNRSI